jgi:hypothetical protein
VISGAAGGGLEIRVGEAEVERAIRIVEGLGLGEVKVDRGAIATSAIPDDPSVVTRALAEAGIYLSELEVKRATLEQAFLQLTAGDKEEGEG